MAKEIIMPALGMAQETGVLLQWLKAEGDEVTKGEPLMEIETDKTTVEVEATASGILANLTAGPGDEVPVGQVIALLLAEGESAPEPAQAGAVSETAPASTAAETASASPAAQPETRAEVLASPVASRIAAEHNVDLRQVEAKGGRIQKEDVLAYLEQQRPGGAAGAGRGDGRVPASPKARRLAGEQSLDLAEINGSGPEGAVLAADVVAAAEKAQAAPTPTPTPAPAATGEAVPVSRMWQIMAQRLTESWTSVPHFYLTAEANASRLKAWRTQVQQRIEAKVTFTDLLVKIVAAALRRHPRLNASWENEGIIHNNDINVGLAVAVEEGLLVPVIHQADRLGLNDLALRRQEVVSRAQDGKLLPADMSGGTFTLSNLGMFGVDAFNAIVNPPQAAILALGRIAERVVPVAGQPAVQPMMTLTLSCDHRVADGARGAEFLQTVARFIEEPLAVLD